MKEVNIMSFNLKEAIDKLRAARNAIVETEEPEIKQYYFKRGNAHEEANTIQKNGTLQHDQRATGGTVGVFTYWGGCPISVIKDAIRHAAAYDGEV